MLDTQIDCIVTKVRLQPDWRESIIQRVLTLSERERIASERRQGEDRLKRLGKAYVDGLISERVYEAERRRLQERLASLVVPEIDIAVEAGALLEQIQDLWREATVEERHELLTGMVEAVYVDLPSRLVVGITPRGLFRQAFGAPAGHLLVPPEKASQVLLWWRRRGIEPLVQRKTSPNVYKLSRRFLLARRTSASEVSGGPADSSCWPPVSASGEPHLDFAAPAPARRGKA